jgi:hypothetical protein
MMRGILRLGCLLSLALLLLPATGCGKKGTTVTGSVTYDNEPVQSGYISFTTADGKGDAGGRIQQGRYKVENVPPGKKIVRIMSADTSQAPRSSGEDVGKAGPQEPRARDDLIAPDAVGNNEEVEVGSAPMKRDFSLERPKRVRTDTPVGPHTPGRGMPGNPGLPKGPGGQPPGLPK